MMMKKITALSLVACAMLVVSVRESQAEEWPDVWDNGCSYTPSPEWTKFGDWCHSESGKSDHHEQDRIDCKDFGGTSHPHWCIATPAVSMNDEAQVVEDLRSDLEQLEIKLRVEKELAVDIEVSLKNEINELRTNSESMGDQLEEQKQTIKELTEASSGGSGDGYKALRPYTDCLERMNEVTGRVSSTGITYMIDACKREHPLE
jgi:hypothetical protein